ncbi:hypothetical protein [Acinetobacter baumannii]|uniref:hypothetical protein n=1 Tax=Acinetobacter baumannii TaxID=470 RepID=UPI001CEC314B|nr:hypothetical protein [Acinetobacter baumannii]
MEQARILAVLGDSVTTDHISPAGNIKKDSPAGRDIIRVGTFLNATYGILVTSV